METLLYLIENILLLVVNVIVGVVAFRGYFASADRESSLFLLGISSMLGGMITVATLVIWFFPWSETAYADNIVAIQLVSMADTCLWTWAVVVLIRRYVRLQRNGSMNDAARAPAAG